MSPPIKIGMLENLWHNVDKVWLTVFILGLVTPRWAIGDSKIMACLEPNTLAATNLPSVSVSISLLIRLVEMPKSTSPYPSALSFL